MAAGPALTLSGMEDHARFEAQDTDTVNPGLTSAQYYALINQTYLRWFEKVEQRTVWSVALFSGLALDGTSTPIRVGTITDTGLPRIVEVLGIFDEGTDIAALGANIRGGYPLKREDDLQTMLAEDPYRQADQVYNVGIPTRYAIFRAASAPTSATTNRGQVTVYFDK